MALTRSEKMGGRGSISGAMTNAAKNYTPYAHGQITKFEAGTIYKAAKSGNIEVLPETTKQLKVTYGMRPKGTHKTTYTMIGYIQRQDTF